MDLSGDVAFLLSEDTEGVVVDYIVKMREHNPKPMTKRTCRAFRRAHGQYVKRHVTQ